MKQYILDRLSEASTWRGIVLIVTAFGVSLSPEQSEAIVTLGLAAAGLVGVASKG